MQNTPRQRRHLLALGAAASLGVWPTAQAQGAYPNKPIKMIIPLAAGSADLGGQMPQGLRREDQRIHVDLADVFAGLFLQHDVRVAILWRDPTAAVPARGV